MGATSCRAMREELKGSDTIHWHLKYNHYPPVSEVWVPVVAKMLRGYQQVRNDPEKLEKWFANKIPNPVRAHRRVERYKVFEALHLSWLVD